MNSSFQTSIGKVMLLVVLIAVELVFFAGVWFLVVIPWITTAALAINLGMLFLLIRPRGLETRIIGMLLGSVAASVGMLFYFFSAPRSVWFPGRGLIGIWLGTDAANFVTALADQESGLARLLRFVSAHATLIEWVFLDLCAIAFIWAAGAVECRLRRRGKPSHGLPAPSPSPLDANAPSPL
jgi:hypothetical protein